MRVFAHRGWSVGSMRGRMGENTLSHYQGAFEQGYDVECDVRRFYGHPVMAHDPVSRDEYESPDVNLCLDPEFWASHPEAPYPPIECALNLLSEYPERMMLVGLKEDSLGVDVGIVAREFGVLDQVVVFDNSVPDAVFNNRHVPDLTQARRASDYEQARAPGGAALLDCFHVEQDGPEVWLKRVSSFVGNHQKTRKRPVFLISPELHYPECMRLWNMDALRHDVRVIGPAGIVTDYPSFWQEPARA